MFDENFSFLSATSALAALDTSDSSSPEISPFTSRCSSPHPCQSYYASPSKLRCYQRDTRYDMPRSPPAPAPAPRHPSITALTAQLESHALSSTSSTSSLDLSLTLSPVYSTNSSSSSFDMLDEGYAEPRFPPADYDLPHWALAMSDIPTSYPTNTSHTSGSTTPQFTLRRRQRQSLVRLQCLAKHATDLMMLVEECHPSSLPLNSEPAWRVAKKQTSTSSLGGRVEKERCGNPIVKRMPRIRKRATN